MGRNCTEKHAREQVAKSHNQHRATLLANLCRYSRARHLQARQPGRCSCGKGPSQELIARSAELWRKCRDALADGTIEQMAREMGIEKSPKKTRATPTSFAPYLGLPAQRNMMLRADHAAPVPAAPTVHQLESRDLPQLYPSPLRRPYRASLNRGVRRRQAP